MPAHAYLAPCRSDQPTLVDQQRGAPEELDAPCTEADAAHQPQRVPGGALRIGEQRKGNAEPGDPVCMAFQRVGAHAGHCDTFLLERWVGFAELAKLAHSAGRAIQDIEEQHQRALAHVAAEPERSARARWQLEIEDGTPR